MWTETWLFTKRSLITTIRNPFSFIPNLIISVFFLLVYTSGLSSVASLPQFEGRAYLNFILPVSIVSGTILFFPLIFLSTTFVPKELIEAEWLKVAATFNPTTYIFEGMRAVLTQSTIDWSALSAGLAVAGAMSVIMIVFAATNARDALKQK
ncbi:ABC transporter permease [Exiguobacterium sp. AM39-5BH]|uniref:ABC transporter permease n=1 Tax=Exiguobacterium sp. AM39-5BH TaxID=2292355 RepID=UPI000FE223F4|nr:ABC transporter permease [Exiguobacterium sp. AM39-5BH]RHB49361.1 hypothetical protein DW881_09075 [Exiguobacterium sp. AM39-5BH]